MMNIIQYKKELRIGLKTALFTKEEIQQYVSYAIELHRNGVPIIFDQYHFSSLVGYDYKYILGMSNVPKKFYKEYKLKKRHGGLRIIDEPLPDLKNIQEWILDNILMCACRPTYISRAAKAFLPNKNIKDNAKYHLEQRMLVCLDIHNFFGSIKRNKVYHVFSNFGYSKQLCTMLSYICTLDNVLPQGSPTSPMLSNLIFKPADDEIFLYCKEHNIVYTRYADDMTFSSDKINVKCLISFIRTVVHKLGLKLNDEKIKVMSRGNAQLVTGIVVNKKLQATKKYRRRLRQEIYYIKKWGLGEHIRSLNTSIKPESYIRHLLGQVLFILFVNPEDIMAYEYKNYLNYLLEKYVRNN